jgi:D-alanyl-D-alanine carboxypeptidase
MHRSLHACRPFLALAFALCALVPAGATPALVMDVASGDVLYQQDATQPWFPASTTKLMTVYVALSAVRDKQIAMDTPLVVSARAHAMPPSKMGFPVGTQVTLDNALKMLMVRSANDIAITVAEGIAGSVEAFADDMNQTAAQLGLRESHFVNPNGLPAADHVSSARDMAIIARALYSQFPDQAGLFDLGALSLGSEIIVNHNNLLGRYPGADGMKTGFTCAAGFNVVASAYRDGRRLLTVVFGAPSVATRTAKVAALFDRGFAGIDRPFASILALPSSGSSQAPDMHNEVCRNRAGLIARFDREVEQLDAPLMTTATTGLDTTSILHPERSFLLNMQGVAPASEPMATRINFLPSPNYNPVPVHIGAEPGYVGPVAQARAPHSAIGSDTAPVTAEAYAAAPAGVPLQGIGGTPIAVDANALPLRGRHARAAHRGRATMKASAEAPATKVIDGEDGGDGAKLKSAAKGHGGKKVAQKTAIGDSDEAKGPAKKTKPAVKTPAHAAAKKPATHKAGEAKGAKKAAAEK